MAWNADRLAEIAWLYGSGCNLKDIGDAIGLSRERVRQLLVRAGVTERHHRRPKVDRLVLLRTFQETGSIAETARRHGMTAAAVGQLTRRLRDPKKSRTWSRETVLAEVTLLRDKLGRTPKSRELPNYLRGAIRRHFGGTTLLCRSVGWSHQFPRPSRREARVSAKLVIMLTPEEHSMIARVAAALGISASALCRRAAVDAATIALASPPCAQIPTPVTVPLT